MSNIDFEGIYRGYKNAVIKDEKVETEARRRYAICVSCSQRRERFGLSVCGVCGCPLAGLTRQNKKICSKWEKLHRYLIR